MPRIISFDGNIGSGKSTFLYKLQEYYSNPINCKGRKICFLQEPINMWNTITDKDGKTIIEHFYADPHKYSFAFQMMAYISRLSNLNHALKQSYDIIFTERCVHTDKNIFAKMLYASNKLNDIEFQIYNTWYDEFICHIPTIEYIYLRTDPNIAFDRIQKRARLGENISLEYITECHNYHEDWFDKISQKYIINANIDISQNTEILSEQINLVNNYINTYTITFDGASRGNPGHSGAGFVIWNNDEIFYEGYQYLGEKNTNNYAEYCGLIIALEKCISCNIKNIVVKGDSNLVIKQINKEYAINSDNLKPLYNKVLDLLYEFNSFEFLHIYRDKNKKADQLANKAIIFHLNKKFVCENSN